MRQSVASVDFASRSQLPRPGPLAADEERPWASSLQVAAARMKKRVAAHGHHAHHGQSHHGRPGRQAQSLRFGLVDMNNGVANQATRCFRRIIDQFSHRVGAHNPGIAITFGHVQPRNLGEIPRADDFDLVLSSGGPGTPFDGFEDAWCVGYRRFLDDVVERNLRDARRAPKAFVVCHSFEVAILHFGVAEMRMRTTKKFGVMPAYVTPHGQATDFLTPFGYRLFSWEHRDWEAVNLNAARLEQLGGRLLAEESHARGTVNRGEAIAALAFAPGVDGTQFHPEADKAGVLAWIEKPEHRSAVEDAYGEMLYQRMVKSLNNPERLARTFALLLPGWLTHRFNELAEARGFTRVAEPEFDALAF